MIFSISIPQEKVFVKNSFLGLNDNKYTEGYLIGVTNISNRPLFFTVHLITGAIFSRLPITAIYSSKFIDNVDLNPGIYSLDELQPYSCLPGSINYICYEHLKNYNIKTLNPLSDKHGNYLFSIDVMGNGITEDPEQHKLFHICVLDEGNLIAYPNNKLLFIDEYFTEIPKSFDYKRNRKYLTIKD